MIESTFQEEDKVNRPVFSETPEVKRHSLLSKCPKCGIMTYYEAGKECLRCLDGTILEKI